MTTPFLPVSEPHCSLSCAPTPKSNFLAITSIRPEKRLDLVVMLKPSADLNEVDRAGMAKDTYEILGQRVTQVEIPVGPGRDTARMVTIAALDQQLRILGFNMADQFNAQLIQHMSDNGGAGRREVR